LGADPFYLSLRTTLVGGCAFGLRMVTQKLFLVFTILLLGCGGTVVADNLTTSGNWTYFADTVMGGKSSGTAERLNVNGRSAIKLTGNVTTENNGGFIQVRRAIAVGQESDFEGLSFETKGNGEIYYIHIRNGSSRLPWQYYSASFRTSENWETIKIPFSDFQRSGSFMAKSLKKKTINSIGLVAYGKDHQALVLISNLLFY